MPIAAISLPLATLLGGAITAGTTVVGAKMASGANRHASEIEGQAMREALAFEREEAARERADWEAGQARLAPFRPHGAGVGAPPPRTLADLRPGAHMAAPRGAEGAAPPPRPTVRPQAASPPPSMLPMHQLRPPSASMPRTAPLSMPPPRRFLRELAPRARY